LGARSADDVGSGITALAVRALAGLPADLEKMHLPAIDRALATLVERARPHGWVEDPGALAGQSYETYATAETLLALVARGRAEDVALLASGLAARQLGQATGP